MSRGPRSWAAAATVGIVGVLVVPALAQMPGVGAWTSQRVTITAQPDAPLVLLSLTSDMAAAEHIYWRTVFGVRNRAAVAVVAFEVRAVFTTAFGDVMGEHSVVYDKQSPNGFMAAPVNTMVGNSVVPAGGTRDFMHGGVIWATVVLEAPIQASAVAVSISRVKFGDGTVWQAEAK